MIQCCSELHKSNSDGSGFVFHPSTIHQNTPLMFSVKSSTTLPGRSLYYGTGAINRISRENNGPADEKCNYARSKSAVEHHHHRVKIPFSPSPIAENSR
jgi:hypothetical protein